MRNLMAVREAVVSHDLDADNDLFLGPEEVREGIRILAEAPATDANLRLLKALKRISRRSEPVDLVGDRFRQEYGELATELRSLLFRADVAGRNEGRPQLVEVERYVERRPEHRALLPQARVALAAGLSPARPRGVALGSATLEAMPPDNDSPPLDRTQVKHSSRSLAAVDSSAPLTPAQSIARVVEATHRPPLEEVRAQQRSPAEMFWSAVGRGLSAVGRGIDRAVEAAGDVLAVAGSALLFALASPMLLWGTEPSALWDRTRRIAEPVFNTLGGVASGVIQWPLTAIGVGLSTVRNLTSLRWARSVKGAAETALQPLLGALLTLTQPLLFGLKELSDSLGDSRGLTHEEREALSYDFSDELLESARIFRSPTILHGLMGLVGGIGAFAIGDDVYEFYPLGVTTVRHELIHSTQYRESMGGRVGFLADYWADMLSNALTMDIMSAYVNTRAEREAFALENDPR